VALRGRRRFTSMNSDVFAVRLLTKQSWSCAKHFSKRSSADYFWKRTRVTQAAGPMQRPCEIADSRQGPHSREFELRT